jgi:hypothetical protein
MNVAFIKVAPGHWVRQQRGDSGLRATKRDEQLDSISRTAARRRKYSTSSCQCQIYVSEAYLRTPRKALNLNSGPGFP